MMSAAVTVAAPQAIRSQQVMSDELARTLLGLDSNPAYSLGRFFDLNLCLFEEKEDAAEDDRCYWIMLQDTSLPFEARAFMRGSTQTWSRRYKVSWQLLDLKPYGDYEQISFLPPQALMDALGGVLAELYPNVSNSGTRRDDVVRLTNMVRAANTMNVAALKSMGRNLDSVEVHQLLFWHETWLLVHPEFQQLPLELVLRMRGLGGWLEHAGYGLL